VAHQELVQKIICRSRAADVRKKCCLFHYLYVNSSADELKPSLYKRAMRQRFCRMVSLAFLPSVFPRRLFQGSAAATARKLQAVSRLN